jgi:hypothetical protein
MQSSRFQIVLIAALSMGLGVSLTTSVAVGYPAGSAVSTGANPVDSWAGNVSSTSTPVLTAPADQDLVITDVHLSCNSSCDTRVELRTSGDALVGNFWVSGGYGSSYDSLSIQQAFSSGLRIPAGQTLNISNTTGHSVAYTLSGYQAQP